MMMLVCFDLPRTTKVERRQANRYQKKLVELGFTRKQFSLYEREIRQKKTRQKVIEVLRTELPNTGVISLYLLPNEVNDQQVTILGENAVKRTIRKPQLIFL
ncbi:MULTISPECIES: CRISPR-associated endonuclease Cas2 [Tetragenococcus]|uniref:CRISPR-associated endoribonuclease Cas2 n=1 Tax=Tetragenococcus muriaticus 3MR10-3 TaxID=1302648 RepID=A0A091CDX7_9ENTE|nr:MULTISPECIES: CRISPR-associated endonuclease Cas2 [Tetragenococcus]KFN92533.1 CRISPR-associated Cas2 family protein [Tetragenococcus muriaticus 3MR10-3]MCF1613633.1 CRISPR-associated endonuclease Cas2 [Tetragenococcus koreensis]MCF1623371.1 CRISPR-associated endonuclease Cas2 [Tetragenococcus koreensis]